MAFFRAYLDTILKALTKPCRSQFEAASPSTALIFILYLVVSSFEDLTDDEGRNCWRLPAGGTRAGSLADCDL